jgi:hypothetical protein
MKEFFLNHPEQRFSPGEVMAQCGLEPGERTKRAFELCKELVWEEGGWIIPMRTQAKNHTVILTKRAPEILDAELTLTRQESGTTRLRRRHTQAIRWDKTGLSNLEIAYIKAQEKIDKAMDAMRGAQGDFSAALIADRKAAREEARKKETADH